MKRPDATQRAPWAVSDAQAADFLAAYFGDAAGAPARIGHGEWSRAYAFRRGGADFVIRFSALREDFAKDRLAARYAAPALPIPRVSELGEAFGGYYAISERAAGDYLDALDEARMRAVLPALFAALDAARRVDLTATTGYGLWGADGNAKHPNWRAALLDIANDRPGDRLHGWRETLAASPTGSGPFEEAYALLQDAVEAAPEERHLVHSDLLNYNVLVAGERVSAVLDWGSALYGDFLYDIAWFCFWSPWYPAWRAIDFRDEAARHYDSIGLDVPRFDERLRCCQLHIGLDSQAYCAYTGRWDDLAASARRTLEMRIG